MQKGLNVLLSNKCDYYFRSQILTLRIQSKTNRVTHLLFFDQNIKPAFQDNQTFPILNSKTNVFSEYSHK